jgi:hypothetical protein
VFVFSRNGRTGEWAEEAGLVPGERHAAFDGNSEYFGHDVGLDVSVYAF